MVPPDSGTFTFKSSIGAFLFFTWTFLEKSVSSSLSHLEKFTSVFFFKKEILVVRSLPVTLDHQSLYTKETN